MARLPVLTLFLALGACASFRMPAEVVDARARLPEQGLKKGDYVRYYFQTRIVSDADLPFTTSLSFLLPAPRDVWVAVYARTPGTWTGAPAGMHIVQRRQDFPDFVHGGCEAINVVADAQTGETLASWCNVDLRQGLDGLPRPTPTYFPDGSPLRETP